MKKLLAIMAMCVSFAACNKESNPTSIVKDTTNDQEGAIIGWAGLRIQTSSTPIIGSGVTVSILGTTRSTTTDTLGYWSFTDLDSGNYTLQFTKQGYDTTVVSEVTLNGSDTVKLTGGAGTLMEKINIQIQNFQVEDTVEIKGNASIGHWDTIPRTNATYKVINNTPSAPTVNQMDYNFKLYASTSSNVSNTEYDIEKDDPLWQFYNGHESVRIKNILSSLEKHYPSGTVVYIRVYPVYREAYLARNNGVTTGYGARKVTGEPSEVISLVMP